MIEGACLNFVEWYEDTFEKYDMLFPERDSKT